MVAITDLLYLCSSDLNVLNIEDLERVYGPHFHSNNWETYALYIQLRGDNIQPDEKEYYLNVIKELKDKENKKIKSTLDRLNNDINNNRLTTD